MRFPTSASHSTFGATSRRSNTWSPTSTRAQSGRGASTTRNGRGWSAFKENETAQETVARARDLEAANDSIHMHVWTQAEFLQLVLAARERCDDAFDIEASARQAIEFMVVLRKHGPLPEPRSVDSPPVAREPSSVRRRARAVLARATRRRRVQD